ncbi:primosomal protein DnaI [Ignavigranum ruoffiae]|uniref:Replicative DNA helicase loader DnaI n=1 Tax=Ignavigranum ruoffiae TaxID=89093 RepID=A0A1H9FW69_9LACT|nr:primosomal protein DnaI [Ignavigranum ruoffiae]SEQ41718.1 replicative DNA helicase loader DnaI [Ignavigranum ruoffiae]
MKSIKDLMKDQPRAFQNQEDYQTTIQDLLAFEPIQDFVNQHQADLNQAMIEQSMTKFNEFKREWLAFQKGQGMANPGFAPELFINGSYIDVRYRPTQAYQDRQAQRQQAALLSNRTMSRDVRQARLDQCYTQTPSRQQLLLAITNFIEDYRQDPYQTPGLYVYGPFGVGKTFILGALANRLIEDNISVNMVHWPTFAIEIKQSIGSDQTKHLMDQLKEADVLMIDDIGAEPNTPWIRDEVLNAILEYRMKESLATFFTSNFSMSELEHHLTYSRDGGQESIKAQRIMERIRYLAKEIFLEGESLRGRQR